MKNLYMRKIIVSLLVLPFALGALAQTSKIKDAEKAYSEENYKKAIELYESVLKDNGESYVIYYNLGNSYYKDGKVGPAILNYERALLLNPGDTDIRFNLQMAKQKTVDKIEPVGTFFLASWFESIQNMGAADSWATVAVFSFLLFIICLLLFFFSRWLRMKKIGFYFSCLFLMITIIANIFAYHQKKKIVDRTNAIVLTPTVTVKSSPDTSGTDLFVLHEGTKVAIKSKLGQWNEVELEDGNIGWIPSKDMEII